MTNKELLERLREQKYIYGFMYGMREGFEKIIKINSMEVRGLGTEFPYIYYEWGWPGPEYTLYRFSDYGYTWAFSKEELME